MVNKIKSLTSGDKIAILIPFIVICLVLVGLTFPPGIIQSMSYKSVVAVIACLCLWSVLRIMDLISSINFKTWWSLANENDQSVYLACRLVAYALVVCFIFAFA
ncbi:hypothetical protein ACR30L_12010 [Psychromonas sp. PT13]|uniref:hypothetical protein n=1 Tax=Psychromonas sp. PT13 TaxID=3439547 RepID=UPI003EC0E32B